MFFAKSRKWDSFFQKTDDRFLVFALAKSSEQHIIDVKLLNTKY